MRRRHVSGRRRRELRTHRCHLETLDEWMVAMALQELEPERIEEDQGDALVIFDAASHLSGDISEVLHAANCCRCFRLAWPGTWSGERAFAACIVQPRSETTTKAGLSPRSRYAAGRRRLPLGHEQQAPGPFLWRMARDQLRRAGARHTTRGARCPNRLVCGDVCVVAAYRAAVAIGGDDAGVHVAALWVRVC